MSQERWTQVDFYLDELYARQDQVLEAALRTSEAAGLPAYQVSPSQGRLLAILARAIGASRILEIGSLGGYSAIWLGRTLPAGGKMITLEADPTHAEVARANLKRAGLDGVVEVRLGRALDTLPQLAAEEAGPFDLIFIDADKPNNAAYLEWALRLARTGSLIIADNVVRDGAVIDADSGDASVQGARRFHEALSADPGVMAAGLQTVGSKGYDGMVIALVTGPVI